MTDRPEWNGARRGQYHRKEYPSGVWYHPFPTRDDPSLTEINHMFVPPQVDDEYQAMMENRPLLEGVGDSDPELWADAYACLNDTEIAVIEMVVIARLSLREAGELLAKERGRSKPYGKAWMQKVRDNALLKLRKEFLGNDEVPEG